MAVSSHAHTCIQVVYNFTGQCNVRINFLCIRKIQFGFFHQAICTTTGKQDSRYKGYK